MNGQNNPGLTPSEAKEQRKRYVDAFNKTMVEIWTEKIYKLGIIDTGALLKSVRGLPLLLQKDDYTSFTIAEDFLTYGLWQELGTGREVPRGNPGDIGRPKVRERRPWLGPKYYGSVMNLRDFMADNLKENFVGILTEALNTKKLTRKAWP